VGYVASMPEMRNAYKILVWNIKGKRSLGVGGRITCGQDPVTGSSEHGNALSSSTKG